MVQLPFRATAVSCQNRLVTSVVQVVCRVNIPGLMFSDTCVCSLDLCWHIYTDLSCQYSRLDVLETCVYSRDRRWIKYTYQPTHQCVLLVVLQCSSWANLLCPRKFVLVNLCVYCATRLVKFTRYWISKLPGSFEIYWVRQYLVDLFLFKKRDLWISGWPQIFWRNFYAGPVIISPSFIVDLLMNYSFFLHNGDACQNRCICVARSDISLVNEFYSFN